MQDAANMLAAIKECDRRAIAKLDEDFSVTVAIVSEQFGVHPAALADEWGAICDDLRATQEAQARGAYLQALSGMVRDSVRNDVGRYGAVSLRFSRNNRSIYAINGNRCRREDALKMLESYFA